MCDSILILHRPRRTGYQSRRSQNGFYTPVSTITPNVEFISSTAYSSVFCYVVFILLCFYYVPYYCSCAAHGRNKIDDGDDDEYWGKKIKIAGPRTGDQRSRQQNEFHTPASPIMPSVEEFISPRIRSRRLQRSLKSFHLQHWILGKKKSNTL